MSQIFFLENLHLFVNTPENTKIQQIWYFFYHQLLQVHIFLLQDYKYHLSSEFSLQIMRRETNLWNFLCTILKNDNDWNNEHQSIQIIFPVTLTTTNIQRTFSCKCVFQKWPVHSSVTCWLENILFHKLFAEVFYNLPGSQNNRNSYELS